MEGQREGRYDGASRPGQAEAPRTLFTCCCLLLISFNHQFRAASAHAALVILQWERRSVSTECCPRVVHSWRGGQTLACVEVAPEVAGPKRAHGPCSKQVATFGEGAQVLGHGPDSWGEA